jgi:hypothetical protein
MSSGGNLAWGIEMVDLYLVTAPTKAREEAARVAREAYDKLVARKTSSDQVAAMRVKAATAAEANVGRAKFVSRPGSRGEILRTLAAMRAALACVEAHMAAFERILERSGLAAAAAAVKAPTAEDIHVEASW